MAEESSNVVKGKFSSARRIKFTEASIKKIPTRTYNLDNWREETVWSQDHQGLGIRFQPKGKQQVMILGARGRVDNLLAVDRGLRSSPYIERSKSMLFLRKSNDFPLLGPKKGA